jgi:hypothetical protein
MPAVQERTPADAVTLFEAIEQKFPHKSLGADSWYLVVVSLPVPFLHSYAN